MGSKYNEIEFIAYQKIIPVDYSFVIHIKKPFINDFNGVYC